MDVPVASLESIDFVAVDVVIEHPRHWNRPIANAKARMMLP